MEISLLLEAKFLNPNGRGPFMKAFKPDIKQYNDILDHIRAFLSVIMT